MRENTRIAIKKLKNFFGDTKFTKEDLLYRAPIEIYVSLNTLLAYDVVERIKVEYRQEYTIDMLIDEINEMIGEDCYGETGEFIREGEKIYFVDYNYFYKFK